MVTDGEELKNSQKVFSVSRNRIAVFVVRSRASRFAVAWSSPRARNLRTVSASGGLKILDRHLTQDDQELPFAGHVVCSVEHLDIVQRLIVVVLVRPEKIVVSDPQREIIVGSVDVIETVCRPVRSFVCAV